MPSLTPFLMDHRSSPADSDSSLAAWRECPTLLWLRVARARMVVSLPLVESSPHNTSPEAGAQT